MVHDSPSRRPAGGFSLIELVCAIAIAAILSLVAYPAYSHAVQRARRCDAQAALLKLQMAEERHRANHTRYGSLAEVGVASRTTDGHYTLTMPSYDETGYEVVATAGGAQSADGDCRYMKLAVRAFNSIYASGPDMSVANSDAANRRCWGR